MQVAPSVVHLLHGWMGDEGVSHPFLEGRRLPMREARKEDAPTGDMDRSHGAEKRWEPRKHSGADWMDGNGWVDGWMKRRARQEMRMTSRHSDDRANQGECLHRPQVGKTKRIVAPSTSPILLPSASRYLGQAIE